MKLKKTVGAVLASAMVMALALTGCGGSSSSNTLVVGSAQFNGVFSPFFASSQYDMDVCERVIEPLIRNNRKGEPVDGLCYYKEPEIIEEDGMTKTIYTFELKDDVKFSDGTPVTSDDIIFSLKILCDPSYDGKIVTYTLPIEGVNEYRYDDVNYKSALAEIDQKVNAFDPSNPSEEVVKEAARILALNYDMNESDFMPGSEYYEDETVPVLPDAYRKLLEKEYVKSNLDKGENAVPEISGVERVDDKTVKITLDAVDPTAIWELGGIYLVSRNYFGGDFPKGDLSAIKAKNGAPFGTGPFVFKSYANNVVTLEANDNYYKGRPKYDKLKFQVVDESAKLENVKQGVCDITDPSASLEMVAKAKEEGLHIELVDNNGYGYIGINADRVPKEVRKGLMCLMNREPAIKAYYGDELASVIERSVSRVSWAYPENAEPYYNYSKDEALSHFLNAGFVQENGKLMKNGKQLRVEIYVGQLDTHPAGPIITQMKADLASLGGELVIQDVAPDVLFDKMTTHTADMWVAAWSATLDPDMYQLFHSESNDNPYRLKNKELDKLMMDARKTLNIDERKPLYEKALDIIMEEAVEMPVYQRKNMVIFNPKNVDVESIAKDQTPVYSWYMEIENLRAAQ